MSSPDIHKYLVSVSEVSFITLTVVQSCYVLDKHVNSCLEIHRSEVEQIDFLYRDLEEILQDLKINPYRSNTELHMTVCKFGQQRVKRSGENYTSKHT
jgi:hypothetical protein